MRIHENDGGGKPHRCVSACTMWWVRFLDFSGLMLSVEQPDKDTPEMIAAA